MQDSNGSGSSNGRPDSQADNGHFRQKEYFVSPSRGQRDFFEVVGDIVDFITEDELSNYKVVVGTDSEHNGTVHTADFVSVVVVHRVGKHGRYFWKRNRSVKTFDRHDRILKEASFSLDLAQRVVAELRIKLNERLYDFEIHLDIGQNGPTKTMIQEIVGMITGNGFTARIKPDSYAANKVADRHV